MRELLSNWRAALTAGLGLSAASAGFGAEADKGNYTLFHPTPAAQMRELTTDRPDKTESPFTVDAGHAQLEMDLVTFSYDRRNVAHDDTRVRSWSFAPVNLKLGLCNSADLQLILPTFNQVRTSSTTAGMVQRPSGFGDVLTRLKVNLWGNDGGTTALGLMPYVKWPTAQSQLGNGSVEGGLIVPLAVKLPRGWDLGAMAQFDAARDVAGRGHHAEFIQSITFSHDLVGKLGGYAEFFSSVSAERGSSWIATADFGLTYGLTPNLQLDAGVNLGLTRAADDVAPFVGISARF
ncbi:MAG: transporter [Verrucomicrobia bacterium]|nr:transporter [Verrucomicrobiota bacterium]